MSPRRHLVRQACGCTHDGQRWLELCAAHTFEAGELHARAQAEHQASADMRQITSCVACGGLLPWPRVHVDTCSERCYRKELDRQRAAIAAEVNQP